MKIVNCWKLFTIFSDSSILDVWLVNILVNIHNIFEWYKYSSDNHYTMAPQFYKERNF